MATYKEKQLNGTRFIAKDLDNGTKIFGFVKGHDYTKIIPVN
ncbi:hypothetical protein [Tenacibaculum maritimum]|nr:hypothetical protein [Tenacibaculum maritimum]